MNNIFIPVVISSGVNRSQKRQPIEVKIRKFLEEQQVKPVTGNVEAIVNIYYLGKQISDIDNCLKVIFDGTKRLLFDDDKDIKKVTCHIFENSGKVGFNIEIHKIK